MKIADENIICSAKFILSDEALFIPIKEISDTLREKIRHREDDFAVTMGNSRERSKVVSLETRELLLVFQRPQSIIDAIREYSSRHDSDPIEVLNRAGSIILNFIETGVLIPDGEPRGDRDRLKLYPGARIGEFSAVRQVQSLEDSEIHVGLYRALPAALKISKHRGTAHGFDRFANEKHFLANIPGHLCAQLLDAGYHEDHPYLVVEWIDGVSPIVYAEHLRAETGNALNRQLLEFSIDIVRTYEVLHDAGVIHGDIHPGNILVNPNGNIRLIDFGLARYGNDTSRMVPRGGVEPYVEPEYAASLLLKRPPPPSSYSGEQYALASLIYEIICGGQYLHFNIEKTRLLRQIVEDQPIPLAAKSIFGGAGVQAVLARALAKRPADRYDSLKSFRAALERASSISSPAIVSPMSAEPDKSSASAVDNLIIKRFLDDAHGQHSAELRDAIFSHAPAASLNFGGAGIAYALYRISTQLGRADVLSSADLWITDAVRVINEPLAFYSKAMDLVPETLGASSFYHGPPGVYCVQAMIAGTLGDWITQRDAVRNFIKSTSAPENNIDLTLGRAGHLLGVSFLLAASEDNETVNRPELLSYGASILNDLWPDGTSARVDNLEMNGLAHGVAGVLYPSLRWCRECHQSFPNDLPRTLRNLLGQGESHEGGLRWKRAKSSDDYVPSWCNGSAGMIHLWTEAYRATGDRQFLSAALLVGKDVIGNRDTRPTLCCGYAGRAFAMLNLYKHTADEEWRSQAERMFAKTRDVSGYSLYNGILGSVLLALDLSLPHEASMPMFESS